MGKSHFLAARLGPGEPLEAAGTPVLALGGRRGGEARGHCVRHGIRNVPECFSGRGCPWVPDALSGLGELFAVDAEVGVST